MPTNEVLVSDYCRDLHVCSSRLNNAIAQGYRIIQFQIFHHNANSPEPYYSLIAMVEKLEERKGAIDET